MRVYICCFFTVLFCANVSAQSISFVVNKGEIFTQDGTVLRNTDNSVDLRSDFSVWAGFAQGSLLNSFEEDLASFSGSFDVSSLNSTLSTISWEAVPLSTGILSNANDFQLNNKAGVIGDTPLLLVTSSTSFNNLTVSDQIGLVGSSTKVIELANQIVDFSGTNQWDIGYLGTLGSLTLQAVPEPSTYALIAGLGVLGFVLIRRRMRR